MGRNSKLILKNSIVLTIRLLIVLCLSFYTTRITLEVIGDSNYGIYNIVGGVIVIFSIITMPLSSTFQRFFNVEFEKGRLSPSVIFSSSFVLVIAITGIMIILYETIGSYFINYIIKIPAESRGHVGIVYQIVVLTNIFLFLQLPYSSLLYAKEDFGFGAVLEILLALYRLALLFVIPIFAIDILISYALILMSGYLLMFICYIVYCNIKYPDCRVSGNFSKKLCKEMTGFSGWNLIESASGIAQTYGSNIIINLFGGVLYNTAYGITRQFSSAVMQFSSNTLRAIVPQITIAQENGNFYYRNKLALSSIKVSFILLGFICVIFQISGNYILELWLNNVPDHVFHFLQVSLITSVFASILIPLRSIIISSGEIKFYFIAYGIIGLSSVGLMYLLLYFSVPIVGVMYILLADNLLYIIIAVFAIKHNSIFPLRTLLKNLSISTALLLPTGICYHLLTFIPIQSLANLFLAVSVSGLLLCIGIYFFLLDDSEKKLINKLTYKLCKILHLKK